MTPFGPVPLPPFNKLNQVLGVYREMAIMTTIHRNGFAVNGCGRVRIVAAVRCYNKTESRDPEMHQPGREISGEWHLA